MFVHSDDGSSPPNFTTRMVGDPGGRVGCPESECVWSVRMRFLYLFDHREGTRTQGKLVSEGLTMQKQLYSTA